MAEQEQKDNFWQDNQKASKVLKEKNAMQKDIDFFDDLKEKFEFAKILFDEVKNGDSINLEYENEVARLAKEVFDFKIAKLLGGKFDYLDAIVSLQSGAGGTESCDWVQMLYRMYAMYANKNGYKVEVLDQEEGDEVGLKSITFLVKGTNAFGYLKNESGIHRLVRISPFDSAKRRHTTFASCEVAPMVEDESEIEIKKDDVKIDTFRSGGAGGQHVNKTESAIRLTHIPTGIVVVCQSERSSFQNKELAFKLLASKLARIEEAKKQAEKDEKNKNLKKIEWGSQIRSYVFCPYTMVKDHRTNFETPNVFDVLDGNLTDFLNEMIKKQNS